MFTITGVYAVKFYPTGSVSRDKSAFKMTLNTEKGVMAFLDEQKPFVEIEITNAETKENLTKYFMG
uniref:Uncharacterized protein n=1 Tax=viral metagenome TaxID=1070528 RepID=A0A6M3L010_9ZZZZ